MRSKYYLQNIFYWQPRAYFQGLLFSIRLLFQYKDLDHKWVWRKKFLIEGDWDFFFWNIRRYP